MLPMPTQLGVQFAPGTMLGRYELLATIGTGGMANVILARQRGPAGFEKLVVIKLIHPHMAQDPAAINMLLDEAKVAALIDHQNVVHTYELGEAYGTFYIVMEYLAGESLAQVLKAARQTQMPLSPFIAGKIVADAAEGLHFAHELHDYNGNHLGIVHRDVSPGNIVIQYNGAVKVVDFGIAKAHDRITSTQEGELKGKYGYMPPEQIRNEPMDRRSDVFSLGVVLWEALAQRRLFHANNVAATLMQVLTADRVPPSSYYPNVPHALDIACLRALAPDPRDRFQTVGDMKQAIDDAIWQARVGMKDLEQYMCALFADRMNMRRALTTRATSQMLSSGDLEQIHSAFREPVSEHQRSYSGEIIAVDDPRSQPHRGHEMPSQPMTSPEGYPVHRGYEYAYDPQAAAERSSKVLAVLLIAALVGVAFALFLTLRGGGDAPATQEQVASDKLVLDPDLVPTEPTQKLAVQPPATPPPVPQPPPVAPTAPARPAVDDRATAYRPLPPPLPGVKRTKPEKPEKPDPPLATTRPRKPDPAPAITASSNNGGGGDPVALYQEGAAAHMAGDLGAAEAAYKKAIQANRSYGPAYRGLGILYQSRGNKPKAVEALKTYLRLAPNAKDADSVRNRIEQMGGA